MAELITPRSPINQPTAIANGIPASAISCLNHLKQIVIDVVPLPWSGPAVPPSKWHATPVKGTQTREQGLERALLRSPSGQNVIPQLQLRDDVRRSPTWLVQEAVPRNVASRLPLHSDPARIVNLVRNA